MMVAFLLYPGVTALDAVGPYEVLHSLDGVEVRFIAERPGPVPTDGPLILGATHSYDEAAHPDVLVVPGSSASTATAMASGRLVRYVGTAHETTRVTASVCSGALILGAAGILEGLPATTHWRAMGMLGRFGAEARPEDRVVRAGKVITAAGVSAGIDLALRLAAELAGERAAQVQQLWIEYDPRPPFDTGHWSKADAETRRLASELARKRTRNPRDLVSVPIVLARRWRDSILRAR